LKTVKTEAGVARVWFIVGAAVVVPLALLVGVYLLFFNDDSPDELTISTPSQTTVPGAAPVDATHLAGTWNVAPGSVAGYRVREKLASLPAQSDAVGRTEAVTGSVVVGGSGADLSADKVDVQVDVTKLASNESRRDNRIRTDGLQTATFPTASFASTGPVALPAMVGGGAVVRVDVPGKLTIHGVTKDVTIPVDVHLTGSQGEAVGSLKFPFSDYAMTAPSVGGFVTVEPEGTLEFKVLLARA
jgi:polyisoprenoid-binding protein YceI